MDIKLHRELLTSGQSTREKGPRSTWDGTGTPDQDSGLFTCLLKEVRLSVGIFLGTRKTANFTDHCPSQSPVED